MRGRSRVSTFRRHEWLADSWLVIPGAYVLGALILGVVLPRLDEAGFELLSISVQADTAVTILATTAAGMITFTGLVVSVAVVVVQFGAGQYTPRLVRQFQRDPLVKHAVGVFVAPSIYAIVCLRAIAPASDPIHSLVVTACIAMLIAALFAFFLLVRRLLDLLRPRHLYARLAHLGHEAILDVYPQTLVFDPVSAREAGSPGPPKGAAQVIVRHGGRSGVLSDLDADGLAELAIGTDVSIEILWPVGSFIPHRAPLFRLHAGSEPLATAIDRQWLERLVSVAEERTITQDPAYAIRAIVDIALRALSPAVNDPTTGVQGLDALEELLHTIAWRDLSAAGSVEDNGRVVVSYPVVGWDDLIDLALTEIRTYGAAAPQVTRRMQALLDGLELLTPQIRHDAVRRHRALLDAALERAHTDIAERSFAAVSDHIGIGGGPLPGVD